jgi:hypothetical protein
MNLVALKIGNNQRHSKSANMDRARFRDFVESKKVQVRNEAISNIASY